MQTPSTLQKASCAWHFSLDRSKEGESAWHAGWVWPAARGSAVRERVVARPPDVDREVACAVCRPFGEPSRPPRGFGGPGTFIRSVGTAKGQGMPVSIETLLAHGEWVRRLARILVANAPTGVADRLATVRFPGKRTSGVTPGGKR